MDKYIAYCGFFVSGFILACLIIAPYYQYNQIKEYICVKTGNERQEMNGKLFHTRYEYLCTDEKIEWM